VSALSARGIRAGYHAGDVLLGVDLEAGAGELVALVGPNGAGKSTLLRVLAGLLRPSSGHVSIDGHDMFSLDRAAVARRVAVVPQVFETLFPFTVREIVTLGRTPRLGPLGRIGALDVRAVTRALEELGSLDLADRRIDRISGGERQRAMLAMALAQEADVLLLDEPTAHLDAASAAVVARAVERLPRSRTVLLATHDPDLLVAVDRVLELADGVLRERTRAVV
jgi:ABC-type cobalamin/Fe3+-siderophores transport system ATPase subunit